MRKRIYEIIEIGKDGDKASKIYDILMMICIILSLIPLMSKSTNQIFVVFDNVTVFIFIVDYLLRWITADYKRDKGFISFIMYPFGIMPIIDLLAILPSLILLNKGFKLLKITRLFRTFRVFRVFKGLRYSKNIDIIIRVFKREKDSLMVVCGLAVGYLILTALIMFNLEPETFTTFFDAIYWATVSLTTMGYGDIYATSIVGKILTMVSALFGIAVVALPAGIITAGYMEEIEESKKDNKEDKVNKKKH